MSFKNTVSALAVALGLAGATEGCGSTRVNLPSYELKAVETQKATGEEIARANYERAMGTEAPKKTPAELITEMQKSLGEKLEGTPKVPEDILNLREAIQRAAKATGTSVDTPKSQDEAVVKAVKEDFTPLAVTGADLEHVLATEAGYSAAASDLVTIKTQDFKQATVTIGKETYALSSEAGKLTANATVTAIALPNSFDPVKDRRLVTEGTYAGKAVTQVSDVVAYTIGNDEMSKALAERLKRQDIDVRAGDQLECFKARFANNSGEFGADNPNSKKTQLFALNGRVYALGEGNIEREEFFKLQEKLALEDAKKGNFHRVRALGSAMLGDTPYFTADQYEAFADKALAWLDTEEGSKVKVDLGAIAMKPIGNGGYEQVSGGLRRDSLDKKPYLVLAASVKGGHLSTRAAVELLSEMTARKEYVGNAVELETKTTEIENVLTLLAQGYVRSEATGEVLRERHEMSTTLSQGDMKAYGGTFTVYGRARRE